MAEILAVVTALFADSPLLPIIFWIILIVALLLFLRKLWPSISKMVKLIDALGQLPDFMSRTDTTLKAQDVKIDDIHHEVHYNNGSSVKDAIRRVEETSGRLERGVAGLYDRADAADKADADLRADLEDTQSRFQKPKE